MIPTEELLQLPNIRVLQVQYDAKTLECEIESTQGYARCRKCGEKATAFHAHEQTLRLRHLPVCDRQVILWLHVKRYRCLHCEGNVTTTERQSWYDAQAGCTTVFAAFLLRALVNSTIADVEQKYDVSYGLLRGLLERSTRAAVDWEQFAALPQLGLDEISLLKGHGNFVTIVSARDTAHQPHVLAVLKGREKATVQDFLQTIPARLQQTIKEVCSDLYEGFLGAAAAALPQARIVADRFHVTKLYRAAVDQLRKTEMKLLQQVLQADEYRALKGAHWVLRKRAEDLEPEEKTTLKLLLQASPALEHASRWREKLTRIFDDPQQTKESGSKALRGWLNKVQQRGLTCFDKFLGTLEKHFEIITNYFVNRSSSGWVEGLNNKIKVLKRRCYGLKNLPNFYRRIWLDLHGYTAFAQ